MGDLAPVGRILIAVGLLTVVVGVVLALAPRIPFLGNLPGDIRIDGDNVKVFIPLGTMLLVSLVLTILVNVIGRFR